MLLSAGGRGGEGYGFLQHPRATTEKDGEKVSASYATCPDCVFSQLFGLQYATEEDEGDQPGISQLSSDPHSHM